jgi:hypothetical protein
MRTTGRDRTKRSEGIASVSQYLEICQALRDEDGGHSEVAFRGQSSCDHKLIPSLFRTVFDYPASGKLPGRSADSIGMIRYIESEIYYSLLARLGHQLPQDTSGWDHLFFMQHYGIPTRALDWSWSEMQALWFAIEDYSSDQEKEAMTPVVWALDVNRLNEEEDNWEFSGSIDPIWIGTAYEDGENYSFRDHVSNSYKFNFDLVAVASTGTNERLRTQNGLFTIFGDCYDSLESSNAKTLTRLQITPACADEARKIFRGSGMNHATMYPDLQGFIRNSQRIIKEWKADIRSAAKGKPAKGKRRD